MPFNIKLKTNETRNLSRIDSIRLEIQIVLGVPDNCISKIRPNKGRQLNVRGSLKEVQLRKIRPSVESALFFMEVTCGDNKSLAYKIIPRSLTAQLVRRTVILFKL